MQDKKSLTLNSMSLPHIGFIVLNLIGLAATIYLTNHYFSVHFPEGGLGTGGSACHVNNFFNCDAATFSSISQIGGIPLSLFGLALQIIFLLGSLLPSQAFEQTNKSLSLINAVGCVFLFIFSLIVLKSLCPFCTLYYVTSWLGFYLFAKYSDYSFFTPAPKTILLGAFILSTTLAIGHFQTKSKIAKQSDETGQVISQFMQLPSQGEAQFISPFMITSPAPNSPVTIMKFSDFQCPFCKTTSELLEKIAHKYQGRVNIHYYFYPLDSNCNSSMKNQLHPFACEAAKVAACNPVKFKEVHDEIFANQANINSKFLQELKAKYELTNCNSKKVSDLLLKSMDQARSFGVESTPSIIVNGKRIDRPLALVQWFALIDELLK